MLPVMKVPKTACDNISLTHSLTHCLPLMALLPLVMVAYVCALFLPAACHILRTAPLRAANVPRSTKLKGTTSTPSSIMLLIGLARTTMSCGRWSAFVTTLVPPPLTSGCSRVRATAAPISKSATSAWRRRPICWWTHRLPQFQRHRSQWADSRPAPQPRQPGPHPRERRSDKIRNYRDTYRRNRHVAFLPACMSTSGRNHGELLRLIFFISNKQAEDYFDGISRTARSFVTVAASSSSKTGAPSAWHVLRLWRYVVLPPPRVATSLPLAARRPSTWPTMIMTGMSATSTASPRTCS